MQSLKLVVIGANNEALQKAIHFVSPTGAEKSTLSLGGKSVELILLPHSPESAGIFPVGDGILVFCTNPADLTALEPLLAFSVNAPIKFLVYDSVPVQADFEKKFGLKGLSKPHPGAFLEEFLKASNELAQLIEKVFKTFDKDHSGFIDLKEILIMAKELGHPIPEGEAEMILRDLDTNRDKKVSLPEFEHWWKAGRKGINARLSSMVIKNLKKSAVLAGAAETLLSYGGLQDVKEEEAKKLVQIAAALHVNRTKETGILLNLHYCTHGKQLDALHREYRGIVGVPKDDPYICFSVACKNPEKVVTIMKELVEQGRAIVSMMSPEASLFVDEKNFSFGCDEKRAIIRYNLSPEIQKAGRLHIDHLKRDPTLKIPDQEIDIFLRIKTNLKKLATESQAIVDQILEGFSLEAKGCVSEPMVKELIKSLGRKFRDLNELIGFFIYAKATLEIELGPKELEKIHAKVDAPAYNMPLKDFKAMAVPMVAGPIEGDQGLKKMYDTLRTEIMGFEGFFCMPELLGVKFLADLPFLEDLLKLE